MSLIKKYMPSTLFGRSLLILVVPVVLIQVITTYVFFERHWGRMTSHLAYAVSGEMAVIVNSFNAGIDEAESERIFADIQNHLDIRVYFEPGKSLPKTPKNSIAQVWENAVADSLNDELSRQITEPFAMKFDFANKNIMIYVAVNNGVLAFDLPQRRLFSSSGYIFLLWMFGASCLLLLVSVLFMRNQVRPIRKLAVAAERLGKGWDVPSSFKPSGAREVRQASEAFIDMQRRIKRQMSQRTDMLAGVSHDLRTPLTRLKLELEMISGKHNVSAMKQDIDDMERMIAGYLDFVRGDGDELLEYVYVGEVLSKLIDNLERQNKQVTLEASENIRIRVRPMAFERALGNLLSNAAKYGGKIWVKAFIDGERVQIQIEDDGPGIDENLYKEVFKPFKRIDESRNIETGGVGLGLSIAMDIVQSHGGNIMLDRSQYGGLCVIVRLPL